MTLADGGGRMSVTVPQGASAGRRFSDHNFRGRTGAMTLQRQLSVSHRGKSVEVCGPPAPKYLPKRLPRKRADRFLVLYRGANIHGELIDEYHICLSGNGKHWLMFIGSYDQNDESTFCCELRGWCPATGVDKGDAATALLRASLTEPSITRRDHAVLYANLFSKSEMETYLRECGLKVIPFTFSIDHPQYEWLEWSE